MSHFSRFSSYTQDGHSLRPVKQNNQQEHFTLHTLPWQTRLFFYRFKINKMFVHSSDFVRGEWLYFPKKPDIFHRTSVKQDRVWHFGQNEPGCLRRGVKVLHQPCSVYIICYGIALTCNKSHIAQISTHRGAPWTNVDVPWVVYVITRHDNFGDSSATWVAWSTLLFIYTSNFNQSQSRCKHDDAPGSKDQVLLTLNRCSF